MKKILLLLSLCIALCACEKNVDLKDPVQEVAEYTVMVYGCAGGDLDQNLLSNIAKALSVGSTDKVKMTWQFNMSKPYQDCELGGTVRFVLPSEPQKISLYSIKEDIAKIAAAVEVEKVSKTPIPLYKPENLSEYIDWAVERCPARNYILILWNHGLNWTAGYEATKSALFDDSYPGQAMSLNELVSGINSSSVKHLAAIYNDNCLSCQMEYYTAYAQLADFALGSSDPASSVGGRYDILLKLLNGVYEDASDSGLISALKIYCETVAYSWDTSDCVDISFFDLRKMTQMNELISKMVDAIVKNYPEKKDKYDESVKSATVFFSRGSTIYPDIDLYSLLSAINDNTAEDPTSFTSPTDISEWFEPFKALGNESMYVCANSSLMRKTLTVHAGVNYLIGDDYKAVSSLYEQTAFHKATGWGKVLSLFEQALTEDNLILNKK